MSLTDGTDTLLRFPAEVLVLAREPVDKTRVVQT